MKCEECGSDLELLAEGGRYSRFGYRSSLSYQCPKCKAVYGMDGFQLYRVRVKGIEKLHSSVTSPKKVKSDG